MGFEYFYGFVGGDANQWQPNLFRNTTQIFPFEGMPGWNLVTGMADDAIDYLYRINQTFPPSRSSSSTPRRHARAASPDPGMGREDPRHAPLRRWLEQIARYHLANQKRLGIIPPDTKLEPWPTKVIKNWDDCTPEEKKLFIRQVEIFAAYAAYNDHEIGRVIQAIEDMGNSTTR